MKPFTNGLIYVHGTNGSGKSTLARALLAASAGVLRVERLPGHKKAMVTTTMEGPVMVGAYGAACGGVDGLSPYAAIHDICLQHAIFPEARVFAEGLITPGLETCQKLAGYFDRHLFIYLQTPEEQCISNVLQRRARKGTDKPYDPANLRKKTASAKSWARRVKESGLNIKSMNWDEAYLTCLQAFDLQGFPTNRLL